MFYLYLAAFAAASFLILSVGGSQNFPPPLEPKEEKKLFEEMKMKGDTRARDRLIIHNQRLVAHLVRKYYGGNKNAEDLLSIGTIGLIKAIDSYNYKSQVKFATYAAKCIQNEILMHFRAQKKQALEVSMSETIDIDKDGNPLTYQDIIKIEDTIADDIDRREKCTKVLYYVENMLPERERQIIKLRYGIGGTSPITQREVSEKLGISRSYVSRIEKSVLSKINDYLK